MNLHLLPIKRALNKAYRKEKVLRAEMETFKQNLRTLLDRVNTEESEENAKNHLRDFLNDTWYKDQHLIATKGRADLVIHTEAKSKSPVGVLFELKRPRNPKDSASAEMISEQKPNTKALHELILYYFRERSEHENTDLKYLVITDIYHWYIFEAAHFDRLFYKNTRLRKEYEAWRDGRKTQDTTDFFYREIAQPFLAQLEEELPCTYLNLERYLKPLQNDDPTDDNRLIPLYKIFSPTHLLRLPFANDSNNLDNRFYHELLHIIGLEEAKVKNKKVIQRKAEGQRNHGSLLENTIVTLETEGRLEKVPKLQGYGSSREERLFNLALELCITWINRVLFLKLLEAQLLKYHEGEPHYRFLNARSISDFDELNELFFEVLAKQPEERPGYVKEKYARVPYLNSSLFEISELEDYTVRINSLKDRFQLPLYKHTVLRDAKGKRRSGEEKILDYLFGFLDAYDFSSEGSEAIQEENKTLINASVLGLIFEKINGYRDGSFFTPGFITMYMCRETLRRSIVQKFAESEHFASFEGDSFAGLRNFLSRRYAPEDLAEANRLTNSLKVCDPAVGSGHFLVSALNELIAIKSELGVLCSREGQPLPVRVEVENDELMVAWRHSDELFEYRPGVQDSQQVQEALFHEKQALIENCLFGVDINPNSVKICRLRLWIELLKNAYYKGGSAKSEGGSAAASDFPLPTSELETLPNIDINIKQGNSLVSRFALDEDLRPVLRKSKWKMNDYRLAVSSYQHATGKEEKQELLQLINSIKGDFQTHIYNNDPRIKRLSKLRGQRTLIENKSEIGDLFEKLKEEDIAEDLKAVNTKVEKLETEIEGIRNAAIYRDAFEWRFEFPEVLDEEGGFVGFDVVVGNPPYIRIQELRQNHSELVDYYNDQFETGGSGNYDIYVLFVERALKLIALTGDLAFIIPHKFTNAGYGKRLRSLVTQNQSVRKIIHFGATQVFEDATTYTGLFFFRKGNYKNVAFANSSYPSFELPELKFENIPSELLTDEEWKFLAGKEAEIFINIKERFPQTLQDKTSRIFQGLKTSADKVYILKVIEETDEHFVVYSKQTNRQYDLEKVYLFPLIKGGDSRSYQISAPKLVILFPYNSYNELASSKKLKEVAPNMWGYLVENKKYLENREKGKFRGSNWYEFGRNQAIDVIDSTKLFTPDIAPSPRVSFDKNGEYFFTGGTSGGYGIIPDDGISFFYLLGLLNSKLFEWFIANTSTQMRGGWYSFESRYIKKFPVPDQPLNCPIIEKAEHIFQIKKEKPTADTTALEAEIDLLVYRLYGLSWAEVKLVNPDFGMGEEAYEQGEELSG